MVTAVDKATAADAASYLAKAYAAAGVNTWAPWLPNSDTDLEAPDEIKAIQRLERDTTTMVLRADIPAGRRLQDHVFRTSVAAATRAGDALNP